MRFLFLLSINFTSCPTILIEMYNRNAYGGYKKNYNKYGSSQSKPEYRKYYNKGKYQNKETWGQMGGRYLGYAMKAQQAYRTAKWLTAVINPELKTLDISLTATGVSNAGVAPMYLSGFAEGDDIGQRNGRSLKGHSLYFQWNTTIGTTTAAQTLRFIIFIDTQNNGTAPALADVLTTVDYMSAINVQAQPGRFIVLRDKRIAMSLNGDENVVGEEYVKLDHHFSYGGATAAATDARKGAIFILFISNIAAANQPTIQWSNRIRAYDN